MGDTSGAAWQADAHGIPANPYNPHAWIIGEPQIGEGTWIGPFTLMDASGGLTIGRGCDIANGTQIYTHSTAKRCLSARAYSQVDRMSVTIGDYVFIGANVTINMGVTVGDHALIAGGAVVTKDVSAYTVVSGVPARPMARVVIDGDQVSYAPLDEPSPGPHHTDQD